jgi:hypothetical protein
VSSPQWNAFRWPNEYLNAATYATFRYISSIYISYQSVALYGVLTNIYWVMAIWASFIINTVYAQRLIKGYMREWRRRASGSVDSSSRITVAHAAKAD